jgi:hypothetical protein
VNSYDLTGEYGRAGFDVRHRFNFFGTINLPWQVSLNPLVTATSGRPFNITTGQDTNLDRLFTERPSFAASGVDCSNPPPTIICTNFGDFNLRPAPGEALIPRNFGQGPGFFIVNLRITKTWSFGDLPSSRTANSGQRQGTSGETARDGRGGRAGMPRMPGGGGPGGGFGGAGRGGGFQGIGAPGASGAENKRYSLQFSINFANLFNHVNFATPVGNLSSTSFGESLGLAPPFGGFGGGGGGGGGFGAGSSGAGNRRVTAQLRFNF